MCSKKCRKYRTALKLCSVETQNTLSEFGKVTTLHGVRYITEQQTTVFEKICWVMAITSCIFWCGIEIYRVHSKWRENPIITSLAQKPMSVSEIPFPAVTICPESKILKSKINIEEKYSEILSYFNNDRNQSTMKDNLVYEAIGLSCVSKYKEFPSRGYKPITSDAMNMLAEISPRIDDIFEECIFDNKKIACHKLFRPSVTPTGICFRFNMLPDSEMYTNIVDLDLWSKLIPWSEYEDPKNITFPRHVNHWGPLSGLTIILKININETQDICATDAAENFEVLVHSPSEVALYNRRNFIVSPDTHVKVAVRPEMTVTEAEVRPPKYTSKERGCIFREERDLLIFKTVTSNNIFRDSLQSYCRSNYNCSAFPIPIFGEINTTLEYCPELSLCVDTFLATNTDPIIQESIPSCDELKYKLSISSSRYKYNNFNKNNSYYYAKVTVFFEERTFLPWKKSELFGFTDLLASTGGLLSLFTGFSLITAIEIIYFTSLRLICQLRHRTKVTDNHHIKTSD